MAAVSLKRINRFALGEARTHKKFFIIANIILGMGGLLYLFMSSWSTYHSYETDGMGQKELTVEFVPSWLGLFLLGVGCCIGLMAAASVFRDMNSVQLGDVQLSLPMTASERFFSKLLALCYIHIFPIIVWLGVPSLINWARCRSEGAEFAEYIPTIFLSMLAGALFINCITVLCSVCCGALAESIYFTIIAILCLSITPALLWFTIVETCAGLRADPGMAFAAWTFSFVVCLEDVLEDETGKMNLMLMLNCAISVAVTFLTSFIYRRRDARSVGTPIANRVFFECIMFFGLATIYSMFFFRAELYIGIIIVAVIYIVIHVISSRGKLTVKKFAGWLLKFGLSTAAYVLLAGAAYATGGFGMIKHLPVHELKNGYIDICIYTDDNPTDGLEYYANFRLGELVPDSPNSPTDAQIREAARVFQKHAANRDTSVEDFFEELNGGRYYTSRIGNICRMDIYECSYGTSRSGKPQVYKENVLSQRIEFTIGEAKAVAEELRALGYLNEGEQPHNEYRTEIFY